MRQATWILDRPSLLPTSAVDFFSPRAAEVFYLLKT